MRSDHFRRSSDIIGSGGGSVFPFGRRKKKRKPFDGRAAAAGAAKYIRGRLPGIEITAALPSRNKKPPEPAATHSDQVRYALPDNARIRYSVSRDESNEEKTIRYEKPVYSEDDYKSWEKGHGSRNTFSALVLKKIREKGMSHKEFYSGAGMDRKLFSKIKTDFCYQPTKVTAIKCCLSLGLSADEADQLLKVSGYALSETISFDLVIRYCISHGITDIDDVNEVLYELEEKTL